MKTIFYLPFLFLLSLFVISCSNDDIIPDPADPELPTVAIENLLNETTVAQEDTLLFKAVIISDTDSQFSWLIDGNPTEETDSVFQFIPTETGTYTLTLSGINEAGETKTDITIEVYGKYRYGTWVLNEGSAFAENGSLIFISPKGVVTDSAYTRANGTELGSATQDLFIKEGKMYIISQNRGIGESSYGRLIVANSETLEREAAYNDELDELSWPTHIAVLDDGNIFIRDNKGVHRFNSTTEELQLISGSERAAKNRMAVVNDKVFFYVGKNLSVIEKNNDAVSTTIDMGATISGIEKSKDGHLWVATTGSPHKISKINSANYSVIRANEITTGTVASGVFATPGITTKGDTIYYGGGSLSIYRHIFSTGDSEEMISKTELQTLVPDANMVYNSMAVHPITGEVYLNTIKGYGLNFLINSISVFSFDSETPVLKANYKDYTLFPAGIFFTDNFK